jgi:hypothetical protein
LNDDFEPGVFRYRLKVVIFSAMILAISGDNDSLFDHFSDLIQPICHVGVPTQDVVETR